MFAAEASTSPRPKYGKKARMGTMGIVTRGNGKEVLLIHRRLKTKEIKINGPPDTWCFPGGGVDEDETPEETIVREVKEEVGLEVVIKPIGDEPVWGQTNDYLDDQWRCFFFIVERVDPNQEPQIMEPEKFVEEDPPKWIDWNELWVMIEAEVAGKGENERQMRFFESLKNMVKKYPRRSKVDCLVKRLD